MRARAMAGPILFAAWTAVAAGREVDGRVRIEGRRYTSPVEASPLPSLLISALFPDGYAAGDLDEAVQLWNVGRAEADLAGWRVSAGGGSAAFPAGASVAPGRWIWLARDAAAFRRSFGHDADWVWSGGQPSGTARVPARRSGPGRVREMSVADGGPTLANRGGAVTLSDGVGSVVDVAAYVDYGAAAGWRGPGVMPYRIAGVSGDNQVLFRKMDPFGGGPVGDTDSAADWASDALDVETGRRIRRPGWDLESAPSPVEALESGRFEVAIAPDSLREFLIRHIEAARRTIDIETYTFDNPALAEALSRRLEAGVTVRLLVDGNPAGGIEMRERWCLAAVAAGGGRVYWHDDGGSIGRRYRAAHAKVVVVDDRVALVGTENLGLGAAPGDWPGDGTAGRRGVYVATTAPALVQRIAELLDRDIDPANHLDIRPFQARDPDRGAPATDYAPERDGGGAGYVPVAPSPLVLDAEARMRVVSAPENAVAPGAGVAGLVGLAGAGDEVVVEQLREPIFWGDESDGEAALNPRVRAYVDAARRGAIVRVLLDGYFDDPAAKGSNAATVAHLAALAERESLDLEARLGNPTGLGVHNKMVLVRTSSDGRGRVPAVAGSSESEHWSHVGSLNGSETSNKANREVAIEIESAAVHHYLARVFAWDWARSGTGGAFLPWLGR